MVLMKQDAEALLARKAQAGANADLPVAPAPAR
jgi:hypothetical protein